MDLGIGKRIGLTLGLIAGLVIIYTLVMLNQTTGNVFLIYGGAVIILGAIGVNWLLLTKHVSSPITEMTTASKKILSGDFSVKMSTKRIGELKTMSESLNMVVEKAAICHSQLDNLPTPVVSIDKNYNVTYMNKIGAQLVGKSPEQCKGEKGKDLAQKAGNSLNQIIDSSTEVVDSVSQVAAASEEQSAAAELISKSVESISSVTQQSAAGLEQIASASNELNELTSNLESLINKFKVGEISHRNNGNGKFNRLNEFRPNEYAMLEQPEYLIN